MYHTNLRFNSLLIDANYKYIETNCKINLKYSIKIIFNKFKNKFNNIVLAQDYDRKCESSNYTLFRLRDHCCNLKF